jgi:hypothetical protein
MCVLNKMDLTPTRSTWARLPAGPLKRPMGMGQSGILLGRARRGGASFGKKQLPRLEESEVASVVTYYRCSFRIKVVLRGKNILRWSIIF